MTSAIIAAPSSAPSDIWAAKARSRLEQLFEQGRRSVPAALDTIERQVPQDFLVPNQAVVFQAAGSGIAVSWPRIDSDVGVHRHALGQLGDRAAIPARYVDLLMTEDRELLAHNLTQRYLRQAPTKYLGRVVAGELRGWLSSSYRRLDAAPIVGAFLQECHQRGALPVEGIVTDTRVAVRALLPDAFEPIPGEVVAFGASLRTSDYGHGALTVQAFVVRLLCLNGLLGDELMRRVHLGSKLEDLAWSQETHEFETRTAMSMTKDVVDAVFEPSAMESKLAAIRAADEQRVHAKQTIDGLRRQARLNVEESERAFELLSSPDVELLPPVRNNSGGKPTRGMVSSYRLANVFAALAHDAEPDRRIELQDLAGATSGLQCAE